MKLSFFLFNLLLCILCQAQVLEFGEGGEKQLSLLKSLPQLDYQMARGEYEITSVKIPAVIKLKNYKLTWLKTPDKAKTYPSLNLYFLATHPVTKTSAKLAPSSLLQSEWADIAILFHDYTNIQLPLHNQPKQPLWLLEWYSANDLTPGSYQAQIEWFEEKGAFTTTKVTIQVSSIQLNSPFQLKTSFGFAPWSVLKKHYGGWHADEFNVYKIYYDLAKEHQIDLHKLYTHFSTSQATDPLADGTEKDPHNFINIVKSWTQNNHLLTTDLPIAENFKSAKPQSEKFWINLNQSVLNHKLGQHSFVYFKDEPKADEIPAIKANLTKIKKWAPDLKFLLVSDFYPELSGLVDIWVVNLWSLQQKDKPSLKFYQQLQKDKKIEFWIYVSCNSHGCDGAEEHPLPDLMIDQALIKTRSFAWSALALGAQGLLYYDTVYGYDSAKSTSPWTDTFAFTGVGEGNLFYPCTKQLGGCQSPTAFASLRLKILRDGLEDAQLLGQTKTKISWDGLSSTIDLHTINQIRAKILKNP